MAYHFPLKLIARLAFPALALLVTHPLSAQLTIVDRGLPTANLNQAAGTNRINVAWRYGTPPSGFHGVVVGDEFNVGNPFGGSAVTITTISLWVVQSAESALANFNYTNPASYSLLLGDISGTLFPQSSATLTITPVTYAGGVSYQNPNGSFLSLLRLDFSTSLTVAANADVFFALGGYNASGAFVDPYIHASNELLSGSLQQGSDDYLYLFGAPLPTLAYFDFGGFLNTADALWDKSSSLNVLVSASAPVFAAVPEPAAYGALAALILVGVGARRHRPKAPSQAGI